MRPAGESCSVLECLHAHLLKFFAAAVLVDVISCSLQACLQLQRLATCQSSLLGASRLMDAHLTS